MESRRDFLRKGALLGSAISLSVPAYAQKPGLAYHSAQIQIEKPKGRSHHEPLETVRVSLSGEAQTVEIRDGVGQTYYEQPFGKKLSFIVGGALGMQSVLVLDAEGQVLDQAFFPVDTHTQLQESSGQYKVLYDLLYATLFGSTQYSGGKVVRYNHQFYRYYSSWFQDHVFVAEGMKYFLPDLKTGIDLYADGQRADGLIWDNYKHPYPEEQSFWEYRFDYGGFTYRPEDPHSSAIFVRIPVENIGEHTFLEGLYYAWKATGDDQWMAGRLDNALRAVRFATSSPWYWNEEHGLLKRAFSIDRWDFQSDYDAEITGKDFMGVDLDRTRFGIMYGDNICLANGCKWLAEMLRAVGRAPEAEEMKQLSSNLWQRINDLAWNGEFYTHWIPAENEQEVDFGVDINTQVTLSNAMALLRGLPHDKAAAIIRTYQRLREEMPPSAPGEWYLCYPPFPEGWHTPQWEYMNGGVSPIVAGDLALGAFQHGFERYGLDILERLRDLAQKEGNKLDGCYKGAMPETPKRNFTTVSLKQVANTALAAKPYPNAQGWPGGAVADFRALPTGRQTFHGVPFHILGPEAQQGRSCLVVSAQDGFGERVEIPLAQQARSLYFLHTSDAKDLAGTLYLHYTDGSTQAKYIRAGQEVAHYWYPKLKPSQKGIPSTLIAWRGPSAGIEDVGLYAFGMDNPEPGKTIAKLVLYNPMPSRWAIMGLTVSDGPHYFPPPLGSTIPTHWAAAHVLKAFIEGLGGIQSTGKAFEHVRLQPQWALTDAREVELTAKYEASGGYLSYRYRQEGEGRYALHFTTNGQRTEVRLRLPDGKAAQQVLCNSGKTDFKVEKIEESQYVAFSINGVGPHRVNLSVD